jgi:DNA polymerase III epsilon subunit family exonuclease
VTGSRGSLAEAAVAELSRGSLSTQELARTVLGMRGHEGALARAVFTLLGSDPRFQVDADGVWSLTGTVGEGAPPLRERAWAVVDVETTGGSPARGDRVIDVAVVHVTGGQITESYESLVNPCRPIPPWIQGFTGITDAMVAGAPPFEGIADPLLERLEGRVFVAHNARFDWGFLQSEFLASSGAPPDVEQLCTVKLGRRLLPELKSHGLDAITRHMGIRIHDRHRAMGDALATARLLIQLLEEAEARGIRDLEATPRKAGG